MKKVTVKIFIRDFIFLTAAQTLSIGRHGLAFSTKTKSRFPFRSFSASFVCIADELTSSSVFSLSLTAGSKSYGFSLTKFEKLSRSQKNSKKPHLITSWNHSLQVVETY